MGKPKFVKIPSYIYVSRTQIGFNQSRLQLVSIDEDNKGFSTSYERFEPRSAKEFYAMMTSPDSFLAQQLAEIELHCNGNITSLHVESTLDGYFGRPKIITKRDLFLRRLTPQERGYLQKQFDKQKGKVRLKLVD